MLDNLLKKEVGRSLAVLPFAMVDGTFDGVGEARPLFLPLSGSAKLTCGRSDRIVSFDRGLRNGCSGL